MRVAGHRANDHGPDGDRVLPDLPGLAVAERNALAWGADGPRFRRHLALALDVVHDPAPAVVRALAAAAAWRAGVVALRSDALQRLGRWHDHGHGIRPFARAVGVAREDLDALVAVWQQDPFAWWPEPEPGLVLARVGGFRGTGGWWLRPPTAAEPLREPGRFRIRFEDDAVLLDADVFGARLLPDDPAERASPSPRVVPIVDPDSYLVSLVAA